jgi:ABC-type dipeptide/oligopeptide/nickel transport system permease subunit
MLLDARSLSKARKSSSIKVGAVITVAFVLSALCAPWIIRQDPIAQQLSQALKPPSAAHVLGTDEFGRDLLSRMLFGARVSIAVGLIAVGIATVLGTASGSVAGYYGGVWDSLILRLVDMLLAFPGILLALAIVAMLGPNLVNTMIAVGISSTPYYTRVTRSVVLASKEREKVAAARALGATDARIVVRHVVPDVVPAVLVVATLGLGWAILTAAGLSFLGLGAQPPTPEWGAIMASGRIYMSQAWWLSTFPGLAIMLLVLGVNLLGDGLRDVLDPRIGR